MFLAKRQGVERRQSRLIKKNLDLSLFALGIFVCAILIIASVTIPQFTKLGNISSLVVRTVPLYSVALGQGFTMLVGAIDLSVGSLISLVTAVASNYMAWSLPGAIALCCVVVLAFSWLNGLAVTRLRLNPFVATLATMYIAKGLTLYIRPQPGGVIPRRYIAFVLAEIKGFPISAIAWLCLLALAAWFIAHKTRFGRDLYAVGGNAEVAQLSGIDPIKTRMHAYLICGVFTVFAGLFLAARIGSGDPAVGDPFLLDSVGAAVLGGTLLTGGRFSPSGIFWGSVLFGLINNLFNLMNITIYWQYVFKGLIIIILVGATLFWQSRTLQKVRP